MSGSDSPWAPLPPPRLVAESASARPPAPVQPFVERAAVARLEVAVAARAPEQPLMQVSEPRLALTRDPWPELPPPPVHDDAGAGPALRALERERRLDREQAGL